MARRSPLDKIEALTARMADLDAERERAVAAAMTAGATWTDIGHALGVSAQAAHKRYRWLRHSSLTRECWYEPPLAGVGRRARARPQALRQSQALDGRPSTGQDDGGSNKRGQ